MPGNLEKLVRPTGFEQLQRQAKSRRDLADAMLADTGGVQPLGSWTQVLAKVLEGYGGKRLQKQADKLDSSYTDKVLEAFTNADKGFNADTAAGMSNEDLVKKYGGNQFEEDNLKPYRDAMAAALRKKAENPETLARSPDGSYKPITSMTGPQFDPQATVIPDGNGGYKLNPLKITADRLAQGNGPPINAVTSMPAPGQAPPMPPQNAGNMDLGLLQPDERDILAKELARRASGGQQPMGGPDPHVPMGSPLTAQRKPDGLTVDGRPYWIVNGTPYDNPEGK